MTIVQPIPDELARTIEQASAERHLTIALMDGDLPDLVGVRRRPAWHAHAACRGVGPDLFYLERGGDPRPGRALCAACVVRPQCVAQGTEGDEPGMWGGLSRRQRRPRSALL